MKKIDQTNGVQKVFALMLLAGAIFGGVYLFNNYFAPFFIDFFKNVWKLIFLGGPLLMIGAYVAFNPLVIWGFFTTLSWKFTKFLIKYDPLSVMDRYADLLTKKLINLNRIKVTLEGRYNANTRKINDLVVEKAKQVKLGSAAIKIHDMSTAKLSGNRAKRADDTIVLFTPTIERMKRNLDFLNTLEENWRSSQINLRETIEAKRNEFEMLRDSARALNQAEAFIQGDTPEGRIYQESVRALELNVSEKIAYIEDFERRSKDIMAGIKVENQMKSDEGLELLESYTAKLLMPDDYSKDLDIHETEHIIVASRFGLK